VSRPEYAWRSLTDTQRAELLAWRRSNARPWHSPPHFPEPGPSAVLVTAACYEHRPHIGSSPRRMDDFARALLEVLSHDGRRVHAWCLLPNHYHALLDAPDGPSLFADLGRLHGRTSHAWNGEDDARGRKVWFRAADRHIRTEGHLHAAWNYVHHNAAHHGYVTAAEDWLWGSAAEHVALVGKEAAVRALTRYPVRDFGRGWDDPTL